MPIETHKVTDRASWLKLREADVTASVAACLLGREVHDYQTAFGLYMLKTGQIAEDPDEAPPMLRGRLLEPVALQLLQEKHPEWTVVQPCVYLRDPDARLGATPDAYATNADGRGIVQIKSVEPSIFRQKWRDPDTGELRPPLWIAVQAIVEAHLSGADWAMVAALVVGHGLDLHEVPVPIHDGIVARVREEVARFWELVAAGTPPEPEYDRDAAVIARLYDQDDGTEVDLSGDNRLPEALVRRAELKDIESAGRDAEKERRAIDAEIIAKLGTATRGRLADGTVITAKTIRRSGYSVQPSTYRSVKIAAGSLRPAPAASAASIPERF
ncbi:YqaJ viral recombinase family protein [Chelatococcus daeguensis]|uniref:Phage-related protein, predicted endonuclease n=1 Tax=Chelatococcus sambhunathii TaxID=363953 RepID=A0ABP2A8P9_9HYPH|nr:MULTISPECIES: YqaJ viral recombinase family protein [Chelatococcus]KZE34140.1 hypothetical protein AVW15_17655 [Chelatococcus daeguensis]MBM3081824.1 YqaJ viral recombinase family protein [Chelatococcus daeguensis]CUA90850.1 Phage-related protein, predicted endonuclease [Chelatococcus sambhunathii]